MDKDGKQMNWELDSWLQDESPMAQPTPEEQLGFDWKDMEDCDCTNCTDCTCEKDYKDSKKDEEDKKEPETPKCLHPNKRKSYMPMGGFFWYCPDCKDEVKEELESKPTYRTFKWKDGEDF
jgi:hypothetical protein